MTVLLVHGVPETAAIWDGVRAVLEPMVDTDVEALSLPGFGVVRPEGFDATMDSYLDWLAGEVERRSANGPIHLVGHDWGGILVGRLVATRPEGVASWVSDAVGCLNADYRWHDFAQIWQTPGAGEAFWADLLGDRTASAGLLESMRLPPLAAQRMAADLDQTMIDSILDLYRSAVDIGRDWEVTDSPTVPGLVIAGADDPFLTVDAASATAARFGASFDVIGEAGHFWPAEQPEAAARILANFLSDT